MRATTLVIALTFALLGTSAHANSSDDNKYICFNTTKYVGTKNVEVDMGGTLQTKPCDTWIDMLQTGSNDLAGITFAAGFDASTASDAAKLRFQQFGTTLKCCSDGKSALYKNLKYFCKDPTDWAPDKTYKGPETSNTELSCDVWVAGDDDIKNQDFSKPWSCDGKSATIKQDVQLLGADIMGCCGATKQSACHPYSVSGAASLQHVGVIALAAAVAVFLA